MKPLALAAFVVLIGIIASSCTSHRPLWRPTPESVPDKEQEIMLLQFEIDQLVRALARLGRELSSTNLISLQDKERNLDREIIILRQARVRLTKEEERIRDRYQMWERE